MKKFALFLFLLVTTLCFSQANPSVTYNFSVNTTGRGPTIRLIGSGVAWHHLTFVVSSGTISAMGFTLDTSIDGTTWTSGGAISTTNAIATGTGSTNSTIAVRANYVSLNVTTLTGGGTVNVRYDGFNDAIDPCTAQWTNKLWQPMNNLTAATTVITGTAGLTTYICHLVASNTGTTPTMAFTSGTGTTCGTSTINLTGTIGDIQNSPLVIAPSSSVFNTGIGRNFCMTPGGGTPNVSGVVTYVQQ